jgi:hypothetical protein
VTHEDRRGTFYGLSAAIGKTGAALGTQAFTPIQNNLGKQSVLFHRIIIHRVSSKVWACRWTFIIAAICGVTGILVTYFFVPDMTGVDLADEDRKFMNYLSSNGWQGEIGEDDDKEILSADNPTMDVEADSDVASTK